MRIVIYQDYLRAGGTESQSIYLCRRFQEAGHEAVLLTNRPGGSLAHLIEQYDLAHRALQPWDWRLDWYCPALISTLSEIQPDVIMLMGRNANCQGWRIRKKLPSIGVVATFRTGRHIPWMYRRTLEQVPLILCNSDYAHSRMRKIGIHNPSVEVHPNACLRADQIRAAQGLDHADMGLPVAMTKDHRHLLYVAAFVKGKNHTGLIRMMKTILERKDDVTLLLVGEGPLRAEIEELIEAEQLEHRIRLTGYRRDVEAFYSIADVAISPSLEESMPNFLVEAQYAGLPVVAYDEAGVKECFVPDESGLLIKRGDEHAFVDAVLKLIDDPSLVAEMEAKARAFAMSQFDPDLRFEALFQSVLRLANMR